MPKIRQKDEQKFPAIPPWLQLTPASLVLHFHFHFKKEETRLLFIINKCNFSDLSFSCLTCLSMLVIDLNNSQKFYSRTAKKNI